MESKHNVIIYNIIVIIISIIGAICLGLCISGIIHHTVSCKLDGTITETEICMKDYKITNLDSFHNYSNIIKYIYNYSTAERRSIGIIIIVSFIFALICIISTLFLKLKLKIIPLIYTIIPLIYTIITSILVYNCNSLSRDGVYITDNTSLYRETYDTYSTNIITILIIITIIYIILITCHFIYKKLINK
jgi:cytochrome bd-type quinol oxidase subunit 1